MSEGRKLEVAQILWYKTGDIINNEILKRFKLNLREQLVSGVKINSQDGPLGVRLIVSVIPNPILNKVIINPENSLIPKDNISMFNNFYGTTLNLNELQKKINSIKKW